MKKLHQVGFDRRASMPPVKRFLISISLKAAIIISLTVSVASGTELPYSWYASDRADKVDLLIPGRKIKNPTPDSLWAKWTAKVAWLIPGRKTKNLTPDTLFAKWSASQVAKWEATHPPVPPAEAYKIHAATAPTDAELAADFPEHISPYGRVISGSPDAGKAAWVMIAYCPFCGALYGYQQSLCFYDWDGRYHAITKCCKKHLYAREQDFPPGYDLRYNATVKFQHLDGTVKEVSAATYTDKDGVVWQLFIPNIFAHRRWEQMNAQVLTYYNTFKQSADPVCVHKIAVILDMVADTYYGLPLAYLNTQANGKDGKPLTRAEWEAVPRPSIFEPSYLGAWNRRDPLHSQGWLNRGELMWVEPFARVRHHPAFKYYSERKYGDPDALDRKITAKLLREVAMMMKSCYVQRLQNNYQEAMYQEMMMLGLLLQDEFLFDFAAACQECTLYNHHFQDGLNQQGAPNYMDMLGGFYSYMQDPKGWLEFDPEFLNNNPFFATASTELKRLHTVRGLSIEWGDQHIWPFKGAGFDDNAQRSKNEKLPSMNWPGYGAGVLRVGGAGHRQEVVLTYDKVSLHSAADKLGISCWVDGVPVMRPGGYAYHLHAAVLDKSRPEIKAFFNLPYPKETAIVQAHTDPPNWCWAYGHSALAQNTVTVDDTGTSPGWQDNEGFGELITFKGGEAAGEPGAKFQVLDVRDHDSFNRVGVKVSDFRRTLLAVEGLDGRPYVVDILKIKGGRTHTLYQSAWAERAEDNLPPVVSNANTLAAALFSDDPSRAEALIPGDKKALTEVYEKVRKVERLGSSPAWDLTWKTDYARYAPRDPDGKPFVRPLPDDVGLVRLRLIGLGDAGTTELIRAKAPWIPWINQPLPNGAKVYGYVAFMDATDMFIERRSSKKDEPDATHSSTFLHILEGFREGEKSVIKRVERLTPVAGPNPAVGPDTAVVLRLDFATDYTDTVIFQPNPSTLKLADGLETDAQYALLRRNAAGKVLEAHIVRGTHLTCGAFSVRSPGDLKGIIVDIIGDLTGTRRESALIVRADGTWPTGGSLAGRQIIVEATNTVRAASNEGYVIRNVTEMPDGLLRVDLANHAPFAAGWCQAFQLPAKGEGRNTLRTNRPFSAGANTPWAQGLKVWFPKIDKTYTFKRTEPATGIAGGTLIELMENVDLADAGVKLGDWFVIYAIEPGMRVNVATEVVVDGSGQKPKQ